MFAVLPHLHAAAFQQACSTMQRTNAPCALADMNSQSVRCVSCMETSPLHLHVLRSCFFTLIVTD